MQPPLPPDQRQDPFQKLLASYDAPAFMKRGMLVADVWKILLVRCEKWRKEHLTWVKIRLGQLRDLAGEWDNLGSLLPEEHIRSLERINDELEPKLVAPLEPTKSDRKLRRALDDFLDISRRFDTKWRKFVLELDLDPINKVREDYNENYVFEKECALRNATAARHGFEPLEPVTHDDVFAEFPVLVLPCS